MNTSRLLAFALSGLFGILFWSGHAQAMTFKMSSVGYHPQGSKLVVIEDVPEGQEPKLVLFDPSRRNPRLPVFLGTVVYRIDNVKMIPSQDKQGPATRSLMLDFSEFKEPGNYEIRMEDSEIKSPPVRITEYLYWDALKPVIKSFYFQRCGQDVEDPGHKIFHAACHLEDAQLLSGTSLLSGDEPDVVGGWHNGGDYTKYATSVAISAARLLAMQEWDPKSFKYLRLDYPLGEPGLGGTDDLRHEIRAGLDWLLTMQRRDGAVYRKVAGKKWAGQVVPEEDTQQRFVYGTSTQDTADTAAALAMASRGFKKTDLGYSIKTLMAAEKAWAFLQAHPQPLVERSDSDFAGSGEFLDPRVPSDAANRAWAAAELFVTTGKPGYEQAFLSALKDVPLARFSWQNPSLQGILDYLLVAPQKNEAAASQLKGRVISLANGVLSDVQEGLWPSGLRQYGRGSNQDVAERASLLMAAYRLTGQDKYRQAASRSILYLFGLNPLGMTYVTGVEGQLVQHPSHRWMEASGKLIPGFMVDGPNNEANDGKTPKGFGAYSYKDDPAATAVNESTILNNASLAYLLGILNHAYNVGKEGPAAAPGSEAPEMPTLKRK